MSQAVLKIKIALSKIKYLPLIYLYKKSTEKGNIDLDVKRWGDYYGIIGKDKLVFLLRFHKQFRNIFFYRLKTESTFLKKLCPPEPYISIASDCEGIEGGSICLNMRGQRLWKLNISDTGV